MTSPWPSPPDGVLPGPWEQGFYFTVPGVVRSKSNHRHSVRDRAGWAQIVAYEDQVALAARAARPRGWVTGTRAEPPALRPKVIAAIFARTRLDDGNVSKSIYDAVEGTAPRVGLPGAPGVVMVDDAQVAGSGSWSVPPGDAPGAVIAFARLDPSASAHQVATATAALIQALAAVVPAQ